MRCQSECRPLAVSLLYTPHGLDKFARCLVSFVANEEDQTHGVLGKCKNGTQRSNTIAAVYMVTCCRGLFFEWGGGGGGWE